jgi:transposase
VAAYSETAQDVSAPEGREARARKRRGNRGAMPTHLPRIEVVVDIEDKTCPCCQGELHRIGEDRSERLDLVPAQFRILVTRRPKYACRACEDGIMQAPAPARLIEGGLPTEATIAQVLVSKYADHLPLYRQAQVYARQGIELDRSTLADWGDELPSTCVRCMTASLASSGTGQSYLPMKRRRPVLDPGRGRTKTGQLWAYAADDRPWSGADPPGVAYVYAPDRKADRPIAHLAGFRGILQVDGYAGYGKLAERGEVQLAFCWWHMRRNFYELATPVPRPLQVRRFSTSPRSTRSRRTSVAAAPRSAASSGSRRAGRWRKPSNGGSAESLR